MHQGKSFAIGNRIPRVGEIEVQDRFTQWTAQDDVIAAIGKVVGENTGDKRAHPIARLKRRLIGDNDR